MQYKPEKSITKGRMQQFVDISGLQARDMQPNIEQRLRPDLDIPSVYSKNLWIATGLAVRIRSEDVVQFKALSFLCYCTWLVVTTAALFFYCMMLFQLQVSNSSKETCITLCRNVQSVYTTASYTIWPKVTGHLPIMPVCGFILNWSIMIMPWCTKQAPWRCCWCCSERI